MIVANQNNYNGNVTQRHTGGEKCDRVYANIVFAVGVAVVVEAATLDEKVHGQLGIRCGIGRCVHV